MFKALGFQQVEQSTLALPTVTQAHGLSAPPGGSAHAALLIIAYRLLRDLRRGWRHNNPNLDQLELLAIRYRALDEFCADSAAFADNAVLSRLSPAHRRRLCEILFDNLRGHLCLETRYLDPVEQDKARTNGHTYLTEPWAFAADEKLETGAISSSASDLNTRASRALTLSLAAHALACLRLVKTSSFWQDSTFASEIKHWKDKEWVELIDALLRAAGNYGYVQKHPIDAELAGWRLNAAALDWCLTTDLPLGEDTHVNTFFRELYLSVADLLRLPTHTTVEFEAQEHTAQVDASRRPVCRAEVSLHRQRSK